MIRDPGSSARPAAALRVAPAVSRADRHAARRFRERVRDRAGWRLDDYGITLLDWDDGEVVGCIGVSRARDGRFLMEDRGIRLPGWLPRRTTGEVSRWAALPRHGLSVQVRLAEAAARWMHDEGMTHAIGLMTPEGRRRLERTPLRIAPLGPPRSILSGGRREPLHPVWAPIPDPARGAAACRARVADAGDLFNLA